MNEGFYAEIALHPVLNRVLDALTINYCIEYGYHDSLKV